MITDEGDCLQIEHVSRGFGGVLALNNLSLSLPDDRLTAIIGPNGAGKTTLFNLITGYVKPESGRMVYRGRDLRGLGPNRLTGLGIVRTFQELRLFEKLSVLDNLRVAALTDAWPVIEQLGLSEHAEKPVGSLSYATQKLVAIGRALVMRPRILLLDEPTSGLDHASVDLMMGVLLNLTEQSMGICLIEHNLDIVRRLNPHVFCLHMGALFAEGDLQELARTPQVQEIFFGEEDTDAIGSTAD